ncbi:MAG: bacteriocin-protection protein [Rhodoferax sp.]|nr:bacteriocin-protection protein [Rhodoferax sp.]
MTSAKFFPGPVAFRHWLDAHADSATELLVGFHKVATGRPSMSWSQSVDEALCVGWIDGVRTRIDDATYSIRFTPRQASSIWSAINIAKVEKLKSEGRMTPAGAKAFGKRTDAKSMVYSHEQEEPAELSPTELAAFKGDAPAWTFFESTPPGYRKVVLHWVTSAKKLETRAARLGKLVEACVDGRRLR